MAEGFCVGLFYFFAAPDNHVEVEVVLFASHRKQHVHSPKNRMVQRVRARIGS